MGTVPLAEVGLAFGGRALQAVEIHVAARRHRIPFATSDDLDLVRFVGQTAPGVDNLAIARFGIPAIDECPQLDAVQIHVGQPARRIHVPREANLVAL